MVDTSTEFNTKELQSIASFTPSVEHMNPLSKFYFTPGKILSVDKSIISTKAHAQLLQSMPKKKTP